MPPKFFWEIVGTGLAVGLVIWFFGKRPAYVVPGEPTLTYHGTQTTSVPDPSTDSTNDTSTLGCSQ